MTHRAHDRLAWVTVLAATAVLAASCLGWGRSGERHRTPYSLTETVLRLGFLDGWFADLLRVGWPALPVAVGAMWLAFAAARQRPLRVLGAAVAGLGLVTAWAIWRSPLVPLRGLWLGAAAATVLLVAALTPVTRRSP